MRTSRRYFNNYKAKFTKKKMIAKLNIISRMSFSTRWISLCSYRINIATYKRGSHLQSCREFWCWENNGQLIDVCVLTHIGIHCSPIFYRMHTFSLSTNPTIGSKVYTIPYLYILNNGRALLMKRYIKPYSRIFKSCQNKTR
jgi:hypothetical protein